MSLRVRTLAVVAAVTVVAGVVLVFLATASVLTGFERLEARDAQIDVERVAAALNREVAALDNAVADWSHWDDTYRFVADGNDAYVDSNLSYETYTGLEIDVLAIVTEAGDVRWAYARADDEALQPLSDEFVQLVAPGGPLALEGTEDHVTGLVEMDGRLLALGLRAITDNEGEAEPRGRLAMGRWVTAEDVATLGEALQLDATLVPIPAVDERVTTENGQVHATTFLTDVAGEPIAGIEAAQPRDIVREGRRSVQRLLIALLGTLVIAAAVVAVSIDRLVVRRLTRLDRDVAEAARWRDASGRVTAEGEDEIAAVATRINDMLAALERAQQDLELRNRELEEANAVKNDLVSVVSHELRTPLTVILGFAQTLRTDGHRLTEEQRTEFSGRLIVQARRLSRMVDDLLVLARSERGELQPAPEPVDVHALVDEVAGDLAMSNDIQVDVEPDLTVLADIDHTRRILSNLLENARKYGRPPVCITGETEGGDAVIIVADQGDGVPDWFRPHLFDRFRRAEFGDIRSQQGTGLGLSIVKDLCEANGGSVRYAGSVSDGAKFEVRLPVAQAVTASGDHLEPPRG